MKPVIEIKQLGKKYRIRSNESYLALRDVISNGIKNVFRSGSKKEDFWALQDIDLEIEPGDRVGIIGRNGAGKSTLLKILSRVTWPTTGEATIRGRLASLLEVGTGFHPELTGRENIYLNGSILGLKKNEIVKQFDAIVDFSGVEKFLDTPLKHYSSGMQLRLAFAVAAHLEPDILLIDEVLAVGDMEFQKKCLGKMEEVSKQQGRTILFVSHNLSSLRQLCTKGLLLENGKLVLKDTIQTTISNYINRLSIRPDKISPGLIDISQHPNKPSSSTGLLKVSTLVNDVAGDTLIPGSTLTFQLSYKLDSALTDPEIGIVIRDANDTAMLGLNNKHLGQKLDLKTGEEATAVISIPNLNIYAPGKYFVDLFFGDQSHFYECLYNCVELTLSEYDVYGSGTHLNPNWNKIFINNITIKG